MKIIIGIVFLCVLFFWFVVWLGGGFSARNEPPKQPDQSYQTIDAPKKYLAPLSTALTLGFNRLGTFIHDFREEIVAIGTLSIAAFTIILAFATAFLYEATRDLVKEPRKPPKDNCEPILVSKAAAGSSLTTVATRSSLKSK